MLDENLLMTEMKAHISVKSLSFKLFIVHWEERVIHKKQNIKVKILSKNRGTLVAMLWEGEIKYYGMIKKGPKELAFEFVVVLDR